MLNRIKKMISTCILCLPCAIGAEPSAPSQQAEDTALQQNINLSQIETEAWLNLLDQGLYNDSWSRASLMFRHTIKQKEWKDAMDGLRKPFGSVQSRNIADIRTAQDPKGLPAGDYMVFLYKTTFRGNKEANELITLVKESDGQWRILTYQIN